MLMYAEICFALAEHKIMTVAVKGRRSDNLGSQRSPEFARQSMPGIRLDDMPSYSPDLNPMSRLRQAQSPPASQGIANGRGTVERAWRYCRLILPSRVPPTTPAIALISRSS